MYPHSKITYCKKSLYLVNILNVLLKRFKLFYELNKTLLLLFCLHVK